MIPTMIYGRVINDPTLTFSGTVVDGSNTAISDDLTSTFFQGNGQFDYLANANTIEGMAVFYDAASSGAVSLIYGGTTLATINIAAGDSGIERATFATTSVTAATILTVLITGSVKIREVVVGKVVQPELGQYSGLIFPTFQGGNKIGNPRQVNASMMPSRIKRADRMNTLDIQYMTRSFFDNTWKPFASHAVRFPFYYDAGDGRGSLCFAEQMNPPQHSGVEDRLDISWKLRHKVAEKWRPL
jgi:hypothetical protein